jgi:Mg-chelatase subunit ChlD
VVQIESFFGNRQTQKHATPEEFMEAQKNLPQCNAVFVVDTSGSMESVISSLKRVLNLVANTKNNIGIVTFADQAHVMFPCSNLSDINNKENMKNIINSLTVGGMTNLYDGIVTGLQLLWQNANSTLSNPERRFLIVLTDGVTNVGRVDVEDIKQNLNIQPWIKQTDISCIALGNDVNQDLLRSIVEHQNGRFYPIQEDQIAQALGDCMGSMMSTVLQHCTLTISSPFPFKICGIDCETKQTQNQEYYAEIPVGTLFFEDQRDYLIGFNVSNQEEEKRTGPMVDGRHSTPMVTTNMISNTATTSLIGTVKLKFINAFTDLPGNISRDILQIFDDVDRPLFQNEEIIRQSFRIEVATLIERLSKLEKNNHERENVLKQLGDLGENIRTFCGECIDNLCQELLFAIDRVNRDERMGICCKTGLTGIGVGLLTQRQVTTSSNSSTPYVNPIQRHTSVQFTESVSIPMSTSVLRAVTEPLHPQPQPQHNNQHIDSFDHMTDEEFDDLLSKAPSPWTHFQSTQIPNLKRS